MVADLRNCGLNLPPALFAVAGMTAVRNLVFSGVF
jgi:hypothetical protein